MRLLRLLGLQVPGSARRRLWGRESLLNRLDAPEARAGAGRRRRIGSKPARRTTKGSSGAAAAVRWLASLARGAAALRAQTAQRTYAALHEREAACCSSASGMVSAQSPGVTRYGPPPGAHAYRHARVHAARATRQGRRGVTRRRGVLRLARRLLRDDRRRAAWRGRARAWSASAPPATPPLDEIDRVVAGVAPARRGAEPAQSELAIRQGVRRRRPIRQQDGIVAPAAGSPNWASARAASHSRSRRPRPAMRLATDRLAAQDRRLAIGVEMVDRRGRVADAPRGRSAWRARGRPRPPLPKCPIGSGPCATCIPMCQARESVSRTMPRKKRRFVRDAEDRRRENPFEVRVGRPVVESDAGHARPAAPRRPASRSTRVSQ